MSLHKLFIPTTRHATEILSITKEDPDIRSVVCLNDSFQALPISLGYDQFVRRPTGIIEKLLGRGAYRVDVSAPITQGDSWQLGFCLAHLLHNQKKFSAKDADIVIWATGEVDPNFRVRPVEHIDAKIKISRELLDAEYRAGRKVIIVTAIENADELRNKVPTAWLVFGVATLDEACAAIGIQMPTSQSSKSLNTDKRPPAGHNRVKKYTLITAVVLVALVSFNIPYQSLMNSFNYERNGQLRALRMEMRKINRQKNWVATNSYYFFEVFFLLHKSTRLADSIGITVQNPNQGITSQISIASQCGRLSGAIVTTTNLSPMPKGGCSVTFNVKSHAKTDVRIWLAVVDQGDNGSALTIMKHGGDIKPGQQFVTPNVTINNHSTHLIAAISDRPDKAWIGWFDNLLRSPNSDIMELEIDRLTSTGVGVFQARWQPYVELD